MHAKLPGVMRVDHSFLNRTVAAFLAAVWFSVPLGAQESGRLDMLFAQLKAAEAPEAQRIAEDIKLELRKSGSSAMDLLLKRGRDAVEAGEYRLAIEHLTALTDHAPDFAEGWHLRAIAFARADRFGPALGDIERALSIDPRHFDAIASLGALLEEVGQYQLAYDAYTEVLAIHPHFEDVSTARARLNIELGGSEL